ncbi:MAG: PDZ domain-containing protein, partial [Myxococcales bacterium]|nr:PDZ domain-containing protein [Myxococcales bacterium]
VVWVEGWGTSSGPSIPEGGARLVSIDGVPAGAAYETLLASVPGETVSFRRVVADRLLPWALAPVIAEARGGEALGPYHVELELGDGRRKTGVVAEPARLVPRASLNATWSRPQDAPWAMPDIDGAMVVRVVRGGVADRAGLRPGDLVTSVDGHPTDAERLGTRLREASVGDEVRLGVWCCGAATEHVVTLGPPLTDPADHAISFTEHAAVLRIDAWHDRPSFRRDVRGMTEVARRVGIDHLVVDLRDDPGGEIGAVEVLASSVCQGSVEGYVSGWRHSAPADRREREAVGPLMFLARATSPELRSFLRTPVGDVATLEGSPYTPRGQETPFERVSVLVDAGTYSSSILAADVLRRCAGAELVGEEPGSSTHFHSHALPVVLPQTGLTLLVATGWLRSTPEPVTLTPDLAVPSADALRAALGRDPSP